jgi:hypothetical protein
MNHNAFAGPAQHHFENHLEPQQQYFNQPQGAPLLHEYAQPYEQNGQHSSQQQHPYIHSHQPDSQPQTGGGYGVVPATPPRYAGADPNSILHSDEGGSIAVSPWQKDYMVAGGGYKPHNAKNFSSEELPLSQPTMDMQSGSHHGTSGDGQPPRVITKSTQVWASVIFNLFQRHADADAHVLLLY